MAACEWRPVLGFEDCYAVSNEGQVARIATYGANPRKVWKLLAPRPKRDGYVTFHLSRNGKSSDPLAHRLVWEAFNGPILEGFEINHKDSVRPNCRLDNLELMTRSQNVAYGFSHNGRPPANNPSPGIRNGSAKLTDFDIPIIRSRGSAGERYIDIANDYGVSNTAIGFIIRGKTWRHVSNAAKS